GLGVLDALVVVVPIGVIGHQLLVGVQRHGVVQIQSNALRSGALRDTLDLLAILGLDLGPQQLLGGLVEKTPVLIGAVGHQNLDGLQQAVDLMRQCGAVLEADLSGGSGQADDDPAALFSAAIGGGEHGGA